MEAKIVANLPPGMSFVVRAAVCVTMQSHGVLVRNAASTPGRSEQFVTTVRLPRSANRGADCARRFMQTIRPREINASLVLSSIPVALVARISRSEGL
jgi:hypothetical protein